MSGSSSSLFVLIFLMPHHTVTHLETTSFHSVIRPALGDCLRRFREPSLARRGRIEVVTARLSAVLLGSCLEPSLRRDETGVGLKEARRVNKGNRRWREGMREETKKGSGGNMLGGRNGSKLMWVCAQRNLPRDRLRVIVFAFCVLLVLIFWTFR